MDYRVINDIHDFYVHERRYESPALPQMVQWFSFIHKYYKFLKKDKTFEKLYV